jgi:hypothetical protein
MPALQHFSEGLLPKALYGDLVHVSMRPCRGRVEGSSQATCKHSGEVLWRAA